VGPADVRVLVGGSGFVGSALTRRLRRAGRPVVVVDRRPPPEETVPWVARDLLVDDPSLPAGDVVLVAGGSDPRCRRGWTLAMDNALATARLLPALAGRRVTLLSSVEVYGRARGPLRESTAPVLPLAQDALAQWCERAVALATEPCPPWRAAALCRELADPGPGQRWTYGLSKRAQEMLVASAVPAERLTVLRVPNLFGAGQDRVVARLVRRALAGLPLTVTDTVRTFLPVDGLAAVVAEGDQHVEPGTYNVGGAPVHLLKLAELLLDELGLDVPVEVVPAPVDDVSGEVDADPLSAVLGPPAAVEGTLRSFVRELRASSAPAFAPPLPVVVPPRPERPELVAERQQECLWSGQVKHGNRWTARLTDLLAERLSLPVDRTLLLTASGTAALRLAVLAVAGPAGAGEVAVLPSFTFPATAEVLAQLGYRLRFADVDAGTWTLDPHSVRAALDPGDVRVVVAVDALGNPADYASLRATCAAAGVPLVADSAAALGACTGGVPVGQQADAHAFSMSFAKAVSAGGAGGAVVLPTSSVAALEDPPNWLRSSMLHEVHAVAALDLAEHLDELVTRRRALADTYRQLLAGAPDLVPQQERAGDRSAWVHWVARIGAGRRDDLAARLAGAGVGTKPYYAPVLHRSDWGRYAAASPALPVTEALDREVLALPMSSELVGGQAERVAVEVLRILAGARS